MASTKLEIIDFLKKMEEQLRKERQKLEDEERKEMIKEYIKRKEKDEIILNES